MFAISSATHQPLNIMVVVPAEATQEQGRRGVAITKRWLEATTFIELHWNAYEHESMCELEMLDGSIKRFDLAGLFLTGSKSPVVVENKSYTQVGDQPDQYLEFLAHAYSYSAKIKSSSRSDDKREFIWVTTHPFAQSNWMKLHEPDHIRSALQKYPALLHGNAIDDELVRVVASRVWVLVFNPKQERLSLDADELSKVHTALKRKASTL